MKYAGLATTFHKRIQAINIVAILVTICLEAFYYFRIHFWKWPNFDWWTGFDQGRNVSTTLIHPGSEFKLC
jgi:hypothetical protein